MTGGALASDGSRWIPARRRFLFPVRALSKVFRGKYLAALHDARARGSLPADLDTDKLMRALRGTPWVVYAKSPFGGPAQGLANRRRTPALARCRELLHASTPPAPPPRESTVELVARLTGFNLLLCPVCGQGNLRIVASLAPGAPAPEIRDPS